MGKKQKQKKGKGAEKTALKTEKNLAKKAKKSLAEKGEDDIENLIAEFQAKDKKVAQVVEERCKPSPRCNMSLTAHPDRDELIMFGGEYFNGNKTFMYNELFSYNIKKNEWMKMTVPNPPPPRSAHQAVSLKQGGGQLWIFGGEFASPTQSQFYHYKDLWMYSLKERSWQKMSSSGCPSSRSGHRMVSYRKMLIVFGGFHDNIRDCRYFNDVSAFNLETYQWMKVDVSGTPPTPRSACQMVASDTRLLVFGGYSKERVKKDVERGVTHSDMFVLTPEDKGDETPAPTKWKWQPLKQSGDRPSPRTGFSMISIPGNKAILFGGVYDQEDTEEDVKGVFYNDMFLLEADRGCWHGLSLKGKKVAAQDKKRRRKKEDGAMDEDEELSNDGDMEVEQDIQQLNLDETTYDDGIFKVTVGAQMETGSSSTDGGVVSMSSDLEQSTKLFTPVNRMNALMCVKNGILFLYGGIYEQGDKQFTMDDFYSLDTNKQDEWTVLDRGSVDQQEWLGSDSEDDEDGDSADGDGSGDDDDDDDDDEEMEIEFPDINKGETLTNYFDRTKDVWIELILNDMSTDEQEATKADGIERLAYKMCREIHKQNAS